MTVIDVLHFSMGISPFPEWQLNSILRAKEFESPLEIAEGIRWIPRPECRAEF
jgi:hypothetical protein